MNKEKETMIEEYDFHRKEHDKWYGRAIIAGVFIGIIILIPIGLPLAIVAIIKTSQHKKEYKRIENDCFLKTLEDDEKEEYEKIYQYMKNQKKWYDFF